MTKPEAVTQEDNEAANSILYCVMENSFDTEGRFKLDMEKVAQAFARHRIAAEQRGMDRKLLCAEQAIAEWVQTTDDVGQEFIATRAIELYEEGFGK
jgi:hypothetical protein